MERDTYTEHFDNKILLRQREYMKENKEIYLFELDQIGINDFFSKYHLSKHTFYKIFWYDIKYTWYPKNDKQAKKEYNIKIKEIQERLGINNNTMKQLKKDYTMTELQSARMENGEVIINALYEYKY